MTSSFAIHPDLCNYIRHESEEEFAMLEQTLLSEGCRDALVVWKEENVLVDGHHRLKICERHGISYTVKYQSFTDIKAVKAWMRKNQLARRNLEKAERDQWIKEMREEGMTQKEVAEIVGISQGRVAQVGKILETNIPDRLSHNLNKDAELTLKTRAEEAEKRCLELQNESERLRAESARATAALREIVYDCDVAREQSRSLA